MYCLVGVYDVRWSWIGCGGLELVVSGFGELK